MAIAFQDGFDHYGDDTTEGNNAATTRALSFGWAQIAASEVLIGDPALTGSVLAPPAARTGRRCMRISAGTIGGARLALPAAKAEVFIHNAHWQEDLPVSGTNRILELLDGSAATIGIVQLLTTGALAIINEAGTTLTTTPANTLVPGTFHSMQYHFVKSGTVGVVEIFIDGVQVVNLTGVNTGASNIAQLRWHISSFDAAGRYWLDDLVICDNTGARNNTLLGDVRVATLYPREDSEQGWTAHRRTMTANGQFQNTASGCFTAADNVQFELGSGDFTLEETVKFTSIPSGGTQATIFGKWRESTNERSYRLYLGGPSLNNSHLQFDICTDGTAATVAAICSAEWAPITGHDYHVCVQRVGGETVIFVDGVPLCAAQADANTYFNGGALFTVGAQQSTSGGVTANTGVVGFVDEVRVTKGVARYNPTGFATPFQPYPRAGGSDADFANVSLLCGFDSTVADESSFGRALTVIAPSARWANDDQAPGDFKTVNNELPRDDSFMEAPFVPAANVLTFSAQPGNAETVVVDGNTYTFLSVFVNVAGNVLIGTTASDSIDNLVAAINGDTGAGTVYGTGTAASAASSALNIDNDQMRVTANTPGTAGNAITATETLSNGAWANTGGTLVGGLDIPGPSSFFLTRLPSQTTGIKGMTLVQRSKKTDSGDCSTEMSFVTSDDSSANGAVKALTTTSSFYSDIVETDPSTSGGLTPSSFIGARIRIDRTE